MPLANLSPVSAADECPALAAPNDPFADLDDLHTEDEKREALHENLDRELAKHKKGCQKKQSPASLSTNTAVSASNKQSGAQQANGQENSNSDGSNSAQPQNSDSQQDQGQSAPKSSTSQQQQPAGQQQQPTDAAAQDNKAGTYSSPWATPQSSAPVNGQVMLEPMAEPTKSTTDAAHGTLPNTTSQPATNSADAQEQPTSQGSLFLKTYGGQQALEKEEIQDIADRYKTSRQAGYPGNTGTNQQLPNYSDPGKNTGQTTTISADDAVVAALKKRLEDEPDPVKRKEIQAEIDKYEKK